MSDSLDKLNQAKKEYVDRKMAAEWSASIAEEIVPMIGPEARARINDHINSAFNTGKSAMITDEDTLRRLGRFDGIRELPPSEDTTITRHVNADREHDIAISREERARARLLKRLQAAGLTAVKEKK
jgi:hypothetical protein